MMCYELTIIYRQKNSEGFLDHKAVSRWGTHREAEDHSTRAEKMCRREGSLIRILSADIERVKAH